MDKKPVRIYYDGTCPMCTAFAKDIENKSTDQKLIDATGELDDTAPASKEILMKDVHLVDTDGKIRTGADAILTSLTYTNKIWWPLLKLVRIWPISLIAKGVYRLIAKNRYRLSKLGFFKSHS